MIFSETEIRVLYAHTDKMGIVSNSRYLEYFEAGRNNLLRNIYPYTELEKKNIGLPVIKVYAEFISKACYDDVIIIRSSLKEVPGVKVKIDYELFVTNKLIVKGYTVHCFVNLLTMKPVKPPQDFILKVKSKI